MGRTRDERFHDLLSRALDRPKSERQAFLRAACADDSELADEVWAAAAVDQDEMGTFLERPASLQAPPRADPGLPTILDSRPASGTSTATPPTTILRRLRATPRIGVFGLLVAVMPVLAGAAVLGSLSLLTAPTLGLQFSQLNGAVRSVADRWTDVRYDDRPLVINGQPVDSDPARIVETHLALEPGPLVIRFARGEETFEAASRAEPRLWTSQLIIWARIATGALLLVCGALCFVLRPGERVTWIFLLFCLSLGLHLLAFQALVRRPSEGLVVESLGLYLTAAFGLHLFAVFPRPVLGSRGWLVWGAYLPMLVAAGVLIPGYRDPAAYAWVAGVIVHGHTVATAVAAAVTALVFVQWRRARAAADRDALAQTRALLLAVTLGLLVPTALGVVNVMGFLQFELDWAVNSFFVVLFVTIVAYVLVRHNALEIDRFTAAALGYGLTVAALGGVVAFVLSALQALVGEASWARSPWLGAAVTAGFVLSFQQLYRPVRRRIDRWFERGEIREDAALGLLRALADEVRTTDLPAASRRGLEAAMALGAVRAELWTPTPDGRSFFRLATERDDSAGEDRGAIPLASTVPADGTLVRAVAQGSGGVAGLADDTYDPAVQNELWQRDLAVAAPIFASERLAGFIALGRKRSGGAFRRRDRSFLDTLASHLGIAMEHHGRASEQLGPYRVVRRVGTGGMAEVFLAEKLGPGGFYRQVALKRMLPHLSEDPSCVAMFLDEARIAAHLRHPNIVTIYDIEQFDGVYCLAMEYLDGPCLRTLLRATRPEEWSLALVAAIGDAVLAALDHAHASMDRRGRRTGLVHRDIKPGNILLSRLGEIKLGDFGIARAELRLHQTQPGMVRGTPAYMAPEQRDAGQVDARTDLWSLAAVLFQTISGRRPRVDGPGADPAGDAELSPPLAAFFVRALAWDPDDRFADADAMRHALRRALSPVRAAPREKVAAWMEDTLPVGPETAHADGEPTEGF